MVNSGFRFLHRDTARHWNEIISARCEAEVRAGNIIGSKMLVSGKAMITFSSFVEKLFDLQSCRECVKSSCEMRCVGHLLNYETIIVLNLAEYCLILVDLAYDLVG